MGGRRNLFIKLIVSICLLQLTQSEIINQNVERNLDISSPLVKQSTKITAVDANGSKVSSYTFIVPAAERENLAYIAVKDANKKDLNMREQKQGNRTGFVINFPVAAISQVFTVDVIFSKQVMPHPLEIRQADKHLVKYNGYLYYLTLYKTQSQKLNVKLSTSNVISYTQMKPVTLNSNRLKYGPYENIEANNEQVLELHFETHAPFMTVTHLERIIEVSHWGNIAVRESINLRHSGAKLKGSFSRYEFQKGGRSGQFAVESYKTILPASASGVYYRDTNGNVSTSNMRQLSDAVELELRPRFPLFGGWKTFYVLGYNLPSFEYLFNHNEQYLLRMRLIDHIYDDMLIDEAVIKIILPEGSSNIEIKTPYDVQRHPNELVYTYLDIVGRPVITVSKRNLVAQHMADFDLTYNFKAITLLMEPLLVISFIFVFFVITMVLLRLDFSISRHSHKD